MLTWSHVDCSLKSGLKSPEIHSSERKLVRMGIRDARNGAQTHSGYQTQ